MLVHNLINECVEKLGLKWPYTITIKHNAGKGMCGKYVCWHYKSGKRKHAITIYMESVNLDHRNMETLIAHEFLHAWQSESGYEDEMHGKSFKKMAPKLEKYLSLMGFPVKDIYIKGTDKK